MRFQGLDLLKSLAIFLVIYIHWCFYSGLVANTNQMNFISCLTTIGVPLFFIVNGFLLFKSTFDVKKHVHRIKHLIFVLIIWKVLTLFLVSWIENQSITWSKIPQYLLGGNYDNLPLGYFWFINALLSIYIIYPLFKIFYDKTEYRKYYLAITALLFTFVFITNTVDNVIYIYNTYNGTEIISPLSSIQEYNIFGAYSYALSYFLLGSIFSLYQEKLSSLKQRKYYHSVLLIVGIFLWMFLFIFQRFQAKTRGIAFYVENGYQNFIVLLLASCIFLLCFQINKTLSAFITIIGSNTLGIYYLHLILILFARIFLNRLNIVHPLSPIPTTVIVLAIYTIGTALSYIFKKIPYVKAIFI